MATQFLHLSDVHARPGQALDRLVQPIVAAVTTAGLRPDFLVASGDFGWQGTGPEHGTRLVADLAREFKLGRDRIVCCPGNHEIDTRAPHRPFAAYLSAMTRLLGDSGRADPMTTSFHRAGGVEFFSLNSARHGDHTFGQIDVDEFAALLQRTRRAPATVWRVAVVHHHWLPLAGDDSHIANAYEALQLLDRNDFDLILHGHRHMRIRLNIGARMRLVGIGSINYPAERNVNNQFHVVVAGERIHCFRHLADEPSDGGRQGTWQATETPW